MTLEDCIKSFPKILEELQTIKEELEYLTPDLTKCKGVSQYLNKTEKTIYNYIDNQTFKENYHYYRKNDKIFFVEDKIKEFRRLYRFNSHLAFSKPSIKKVN